MSIKGYYEVMTGNFYAPLEAQAPCWRPANVSFSNEPTMESREPPRRVPTIDPVTGKRVGSLAAYVFECARGP